MSSVQPENGAAEAQPSMSVVAQYVKDLSFENPKAPDSLRARENAPQISIGVNVNSRQRSQSDVRLAGMRRGLEQHGKRFQLNENCRHSAPDLTTASGNPIMRAFSWNVE